jgi:hypothetical protein
MFDSTGYKEIFEMIGQKNCLPLSVTTSRGHPNLAKIFNSSLTTTFEDISVITTASG